jgi:hypothetical protein
MDGNRVVRRRAAADAIRLDGKTFRGPASALCNPFELKLCILLDFNEILGGHSATLQMAEVG